MEIKTLEEYFIYEHEELKNRVTELELKLADAQELIKTLSDVLIIVEEPTGDKRLEFKSKISSGTDVFRCIISNTDILSIKPCADGLGKPLKGD